MARAVLPLGCVLLLTVASLVQCLYEDQIGKFDWRQQYVGLVQHAVFDNSAAKARQVIVSTDENVLAALTTSSGQIVWRRLLEQAERPSTLHSLGDSSDVLTVSSSHIRRWSVQGGYVVWERAISRQFHQKSDDSSRKLWTAVHDQGVVVADGHSISIFDLKTGTESQSHSLPALKDASAVYHASHKETIFIVTVIPEQYVQVHSVKDEVLSRTPRTISGTWLTDSKKCTVVGMTLVCYDSSIRGLRALDISQGAAFGSPVIAPFAITKLRPLKLGLQYVVAEGEIVSDGVAETSTVVYEVTPDGEGLRTLSVVQGVVSFAEGADDGNLLFTAVAVADKSLTLAAYALETGKEVSDYKHAFTLPTTSQVIETFVSILRKRDGSAALRVLTTFADHTISMYQSSGVEPTWTREEALAKVVAAEMVDLPVSSMQAKMEEEFDLASEGNPLSAFVRRVTSQFAQLGVYAAREASRAWQFVGVPFGRVGSESQQKKAAAALHARAAAAAAVSVDDDEYLTRDTFNLHKMLVLVSAPGKVFGLDSYTGRMIWSWSLPSVVRPLADGRYALVTQRTAAHVPLRPVCTVVGRHRDSGVSYVASFDPITGADAVLGVSGVNGVSGSFMHYQLLQLALAPGLDKDFMRPLLLLDTDLKVHFYPKRELSLTSMKSMFLFTADEQSGRLDGYVAKDLHAAEPVAAGTWTVRIGSGNQKIVALATKRSNEHVHSHGKVLADRSVLYKYVNPNLIAIAAEGDDKKSPKFISVYLVDGVTGKVVFHCEHKRSNGPVHMVHSENWIVYTYYNEKSRREEIAVLELFEGATQANATAFSSFAATNLNPVVMRQAYVLGVPSTSTLAVTITERGITSQNVLIARKTGAIVEVPKLFLDPRRPLTPTAESREEGLPPYLPEIVLTPENTINYNQSVFAVRNIHTSPSGLESTSLVLAYGLDLFFTRVAPSRMYDVLKDDFDFVFIGGVTGAMVLVSVVTKRLAHRRAVRNAWK